MNKSLVLSLLAGGIFLSLALGVWMAVMNETELVMFFCFVIVALMATMADLLKRQPKEEDDGKGE